REGVQAVEQVRGFFPGVVDQFAQARGVVAEVRLKVEVDLPLQCDTAHDRQAGDEDRQVRPHVEVEAGQVEPDHGHGARVGVAGLQVEEGGQDVARVGQQGEVQADVRGRPRGEAEGLVELLHQVGGVCRRHVPLGGDREVARTRVGDVVAPQGGKTAGG